MNINTEINKIFENASPEVDNNTVENLSVKMLFQLQEIVEKDSEIINTLYEIITELSDRVKVLEEIK